MIPKDPKITRLRNCSFCQRRKLICARTGIWVVVDQDEINLGLIKSRDDDIFAQLDKFLEFELKDFCVPGSCFAKAVQRDRQQSASGAERWSTTITGMRSSSARRAASTTPWPWTML